MYTYRCVQANGENSRCKNIYISEALIHQSHIFSLYALGKPVLDEEETLALAGLVSIMSVNLYTLLKYCVEWLKYSQTTSPSGLRLLHVAIATQPHQLYSCV